MPDFLLSHYDWLMALHVIAAFAWMAGMLYLPRLFVYHVDAEKGSDKSETFKVMEIKLLRMIMNPAMIAVFLFGGLMLYANPEVLHAPWMHAKLTCVFLLAGLHGFFAKSVKLFTLDENTKSARFYRWINEAPAVLMVLIVVLVIVRPF